MSMNRLRSVAVRIRPLVGTPLAQPDLARDLADDAALPHPRRVVGGSLQASSKRQIWDLEDDDGASDMPARAAAATSAAANARAGAPMPEPPRPASAPPVVEHKTFAPPLPSPGGGRAKTRILGFHAQDLESDVFNAPASARNGPQFPAGFLVVVDGPGRGAFFAVTNSVSTIGRGSDQDVALDFGDESISRDGHASVVYDEEQSRFFLGHGNKANVVRRNGTPVLTTEEMAHGDLIRIGKTTLRFHAFCGADFNWSDRTAPAATVGRDA